MFFCPGDDLAISQILYSACERRAGGPVPLSAAVSSVSGSVSDWASEEAGRGSGGRESYESRGVWVSVSAECDHMTRGLGLMLDDSPLQAAERKAPPAGSLY